MDTTFQDAAARGRFELEEDGKLVFADYRRRDGMLVITHVEADPALRGKGAAGRLMEELTRVARRDGLKLRPFCSYAAAWLRRHREHQDLLA